MSPFSLYLSAVLNKVVFVTRCKWIIQAAFYWTENICEGTKYCIPIFPTSGSCSDICNLSESVFKLTYVIVFCISTIPDFHLMQVLKGGFFGVLSFYVSYSTLIHMPPLRFLCVGGCWDRTQDCFDLGIGSQTL
jgi:hypothetical protein